MKKNRKFELLDKVIIPDKDDRLKTIGVIAEHLTYYDEEQECLCTIEDELELVVEGGKVEHMYLVLVHDLEGRMQLVEFFESDLTKSK